MKKEMIVHIPHFENVRPVANEQALRFSATIMAGNDCSYMCEIRIPCTHAHHEDIIKSLMYRLNELED